MNTKIAIILILGMGIAGLFFLKRPYTLNQNAGKVGSPTINENAGEIISPDGIHWHPELTITIKGEKQVIPNNIGMGMQFAGYPQYDPMMMMTNMHTHDDSGELHWEVMDGPVEKDDVRLAQLFAVWGKKFTSSCIFEYCDGLDGKLEFKVNGEINQDFENYLVKDKDKIEIIFK